MELTFLSHGPQEEPLLDTLVLDLYLLDLFFAPGLWFLPNGTSSKLEEMFIAITLQTRIYVLNNKDTCLNIYLFLDGLCIYVIGVSLTTMRTYYLKL